MATATIGGIPVYNATIPDDECGMMKISLVDDPAVMSNFLAFKDEKKVMTYAIQDEEKRLVLGAVMRTDFPIYRRDEKNGEYYIMYSKDTIRQMAEKYLKDNHQNDVNTMHEANSDVDGVNMVQWFIKDVAKGINPENITAEDGSLLAEYHVTNDEVWEDIKNGTYKGFSLEGLFAMEPNVDYEKVEEIVESLEGKFTNHKISFMTKLGKIKAALLKAFAEFANITTDKGILAWDGDEDIKEGDSVYVEDAEGKKTPAADGEYKTEDNKIIVVADGKVSEIKDAEPEEPAEPTEPEKPVAAEENQKLSRVKRIVEAFSTSYNEKMEKIWTAVKDSHLLPFDYGYLFDCGDDYAIICTYGEGTNYEDVFYKFDIAWNGEDAVASNPVEVKREFVPVNAAPAEPTEPAEPTPSPEEETLRKENEELRKEVEELKKLSGAKPAHEEFQSTQELGKTGDKKLDTLSRILASK